MSKLSSNRPFAAQVPALCDRHAAAAARRAGRAAAAPHRRAQAVPGRHGRWARLGCEGVGLMGGSGQQPGQPERRGRRCDQHRSRARWVGGCVKQPQASHSPAQSVHIPSPHGLPSPPQPWRARAPPWPRAWARALAAPAWAALPAGRGTRPTATCLRVRRGCRGAVAWWCKLMAVLWERKPAATAPFLPLLLSTPTSALLLFPVHQATAPRLTQPNPPQHHSQTLPPRSHDVRQLHQAAALLVARGAARAPAARHHRWAQ